MSKSDSDPGTTQQSGPSEPGPGLDLRATEAVPGAYRVLARKYRPQTFADLIGQEPMVRTLTNAFAAGRIAHAFMLTGVRGVGKTTTARLLARALNYQRDGVDAPCIDLDPPGVHCEAIAESRHVDVMEMDAASHTGVEDIREILGSVRYGPVSARYKVYIIDEVHMLSKHAFNALLKTLEEPPPHAIFIFATTEIRKVPVTVLSRCQRFDLARIDRDQLIAHLQGICDKEGAQVHPDGLALIARAAEGSVRDALSILDQALVQESGETQVDAQTIRTMLGLADRTRVLELFALAARGDAKGCCAELAGQFAAGADPLVVLRDMLDHCHQCSRAQVLGEAARLEEYGGEAKTLRTLAQQMSPGQLARLWQMLLKALDEARQAPDALSATEMALIRICTAATLPGPEQAAKLLRSGGDGAATPQAQPQSAPVTGPPHGRAKVGATAASGGATAAVRTTPDSDPAVPPSQPQAQLHSLKELVALLAQKQEKHLAALIRRHVRLVSIRPGAIVFQPQADTPGDLAPRLTRALRKHTGQSWLVSLDGNAAGAPTLAQQSRDRQDALRQRIENSPHMHNIRHAFPGAEILDIRETDKTGNDSHD